MMRNSQIMEIITISNRTFGQKRYWQWHETAAAIELKSIGNILEVA